LGIDFEGGTEASMIKTAGLYDRQSTIEGLHPPERVMVYVTAGTEENERGRRLCGELLEGLALIGCRQIMLVSQDIVDSAISMGSIRNSWIMKSRDVIQECRPFLDLVVCNRSHAMEAASEIEDVVIVTSEYASQADADFIRMTRNSFVADASTFDMYFMANPAMAIHVREEGANHPDRTVPSTYDEGAMTTAQTLLLVNMMCKDFARTGTKINAEKFIDRVVGDAATAILINGFVPSRRSRPSSAPSAAQESVQMDIVAACTASGVSSFTELARLKGVNPATARGRIKSGWSLERALTPLETELPTSLIGGDRAP
jgi:hypothetical protein